MLEVVYAPTDGFTGTDSCVYEACDLVPQCDTATVTFTVLSDLPNPNDDNNNGMSDDDEEPPTYDDELVTIFNDITGGQTADEDGIVDDNPNDQPFD